MQASAIREVLLATPGVHSAGAVTVHDLIGGTHVVTARLGFGPNSSVADIVVLIEAARSAVRRAHPDVSDIVLEPEISAPRDDANPPTDVFVIRGAD